MLLLFKANEKGYFKSPYRWLLITTGVDQWAVLEHLSILINSDVVIAKKVDDHLVLFIEGKILWSFLSVLLPFHDKTTELILM